MDFNMDDFKKTFSAVLDIGSPLANAFIPGSGLAIQGIKAIAGAFGLTEKEITPEKLSELATQDKDFVVKIRQADQSYQVAILKEETERLRLQLTDVQNARGMNIETTKTTGKRDTNLYALAWVIVIGFFILMGILIFRELPKDSNGVIYMLFGALGSGFTGILGYFFGSSKSSSDKTELLSRTEPIR